ncbi:MAG TPA: AAA family ATPase [Oculatellaceae cyanobacterium]
MALTDFYIRNYRSARNTWLKLPRVSVIVGPNGSGKSNLYRAMYLVSSTANGQLSRAIAEEGGMDSILWSGEYGLQDERKVSLSVKFDELQYDLKLGTMGRAGGEYFCGDLQVKSEKIFAFKNGVKSQVLNRGIGFIEVRDSTGRTTDYTQRVASNESILTALREPHKYPQLSRLRQEFLGWRFYHHFRTDQNSPLRKPQHPVTTKILSHDGKDLAPALATIKEWGDWNGLERSLDEAFPGAELDILCASTGLKLALRLQGLDRALEGAELSDGTLQYLCLLCALYSVEAPPLIVLNEPETSIHPDLLEPLARLLVRASEASQIWVTTHSTDLSDYIMDLSGYSPLVLEKVDAETRVVGVKLGVHPDDQEDDEFEDEEIEPVRKMTARDSGGSISTVSTKGAKPTGTMSQSNNDDPDAVAAAAKLEALRKRLVDGAKE